MCALPLSLVLLAAQVWTILDRQPFRMTGPRQFAIRVASDLTNQQQYWLAYVDDQAARDLERHAGVLPPLRQPLQDQSFLYRQQAALLTRQFAMANPTGWIAIKRALDGPDEFVTPFITQMEERVHE